MVERIQFVDTAMHRQFVITPEDFPIPGRADIFAHPITFEDKALLDKREAFVVHQAEAANNVLAATFEDKALLDKREAFVVHQAEAANNVLAALQTLPDPPTADDWQAIYHALTRWRAELGIDALGQGATGSDRIIMPVTDDFPNRDRLGSRGRLRVGAVWDDDAKMWMGGQETPSSLAYEAALQRALARFATEGVVGDELQNIVYLPDGRAVAGGKLIRGETARQITFGLKEGIARRGEDVSTFETGGDMLYAVSGTAADRAVIFEAAMRELADPGEPSPEKIATITYLLFQSPQYKRGSDAVIRTFLMAAGTYITGGRVPKIPSDVDMQAYTLHQYDFIPAMLKAT